MPLITQPLSDITTAEGQPLKLSCEINGLQVIVNWFHNGKVMIFRLLQSIDFLILSQFS